jgi:hypothetical protein
VSPAAPAMPSRDWTGPQFDPAHPEDYEAFLAKHRTWLRDLMRAEFGDIP